jgi:hypothetical protein
MKVTLAIVCAIVITGALYLNLSQPRADSSCQTYMQINSAPEVTAPYTACDAEMKTTFHHSRTGSQTAYEKILCRVYNTSFYQEYKAAELAEEADEITWTHCTTLANHRLCMDVQIGGSNPPYFRSYYLRAEYFSGNGQ